MTQPLRVRMFKIYERLEQAIAPELRPSQYVYLDVLRREVPQQCTWLDMGCGHQLFGFWMMDEERELVSRARKLIGIDLDEDGIRKHENLHIRVIGQLEKLPFPEETFDVITANMVMEHVENPDAVLAEVWRVLRSGGRFIFHTPNRHSFHNGILRSMPEALKKTLAFLLEGRKEEDVFPTHYRFNTAKDIRDLAQRQPLHTEQIIYCNTAAQTAVLGPLSIPELLFLRLLQSPKFENRRTDLVAVLSKTK